MDIRKTVILVGTILSSLLVSPVFAANNSGAGNHTMGDSLKNATLSSNGDQPQKIYSSVLGVSVATGNMVNLSSNDTTLPHRDAVDIASYQSWMTQADFNALKAQGVKTIIVKLSEEFESKYDNSYAQKQIQMAKAAGLNVAAYHYAWFVEQNAPYNQALANADAMKEATYFANRATALGLSKNTIMIEDAESFGEYPVWTGASQVFAQTLASLGYTNVRFYSSQGWVTDGTMKPSVLGSGNMWVAQYPSDTPAINPTTVRNGMPIGWNNSLAYNSQYGAWQFTSQMYFNNFSNKKPVDTSIDYDNVFAPLSFTSLPAGTTMVVSKAGNDKVSVMNSSKSTGSSLSIGQKVAIADKITVNGITYYRTTSDQAAGSIYGIPAADLMGAQLVTFNSNGGTSVAPQTVPTGTSSKQPQNPIKVGYSLSLLSNKNTGLPFTDVREFVSDITWLYDVGITTGTSPTAYSPLNSVTRDQMAAFMYRMVSSSNFAGWYIDSALTRPYDFSRPVNGDLTLYAKWITGPAVFVPTALQLNQFADINNNPFENQILWMYSLGVTTGTSLTTYSPGSSVTRGQMAAFLHRLAIALKLVPTNAIYGLPFKDVTTFANDIGWLYSQQITTGTSPTTYSPNAPVSREQMAAFLHRFYLKLQH